MKYALNLSAENRILSATLPKYAPTNAIIVDSLPEGDITDYLCFNDVFIYSPVEVVIPIEQQIAELKAELESTDYKVIKCYEAQLVGKILPYDITELHTERQALRDKINELEGSVE